MPVLVTIILFVVIMAVTGFILHRGGITKLVRLIFALALISNIKFGLLPLIFGWDLIGEILLLHISILLTFLVPFMGLCAVTLREMMHLKRKQAGIPCDKKECAICNPKKGVKEKKEEEPKA